jgi:hypothetical protein
VRAPSAGSFAWRSRPRLVRSTGAPGALSVPRRRPSRTSRDGRRDSDRPRHACGDDELAPEGESTAAEEHGEAKVEGPDVGEQMAVVGREEIDAGHGVVEEARRERGCRADGGARGRERDQGEPCDTSRAAAIATRCELRGAGQASPLAQPSANVWPVRWASLEVSAPPRSERPTRPGIGVGIRRRRLPVASIHALAKLVTVAASGPATSRRPRPGPSDTTLASSAATARGSIG